MYIIPIIFYYIRHKMINLLWTIILFIGLANAQPITYTYKYALETPVNIRSGQSSKHDIVGQLKKDERFEMDAACKSGWCKARAGSIEGWVHISQAKQATEPTKTAEPAKVIRRSSDSLEDEWWAIPLTILVAIVGLFAIWKFRGIVFKIFAVVFGIIGNIALACLREILRDISKGGFSSGSSGGDYSSPQRSISLAVQDRVFVNVFDANNRRLFYRQGQLHGYTGSTVSVRDPQNGSISTYDVNGKRLSTRFS